MKEVGFLAFLVYLTSSHGYPGDLKGALGIVAGIDSIEVVYTKVFQSAAAPAPASHCYACALTEMLGSERLQ